MLKEDVKRGKWDEIEEKKTGEKKRKKEKRGVSVHVFHKSAHTTDWVTNE